MKVVNKKIGSLKPYKNNAKKHPKDQIEKIAESIKEFGFTQPVLIDENNVVVAGHGRILGAKKAGLIEVPTVCLTDLTEDQIKAYRLVDNKLNESDWDADLMELEIRELNLLKGNIDLSLFGLGKDEAKLKQVKFDVKEKYAILVECISKNIAETLFKEFEDRGYKCKMKNN